MPSQYLLLYIAFTNHQEVISSVEYGTENATVFLEWTPEHHTSYNVCVESQVCVTSALSNANVTVPYNSHLNITIVATLCGQYSTTTILGIHYSEL